MAEKEILAAIAGFFDPSLRQAAQTLAESVSETSLLKHKSVEAALGVIKGLVEVWAEKLPSAAAVAVEKATDFSDFLAGALKSGQSKPNIIRQWQEKIAVEALERLKNSADPNQELQTIKRELAPERDLLQWILDSGERRPTPISLEGIFSKLEKSFKSTDHSMAETIQNWRKSQTWIRRER